MGHALFWVVTDEENKGQRNADKIKFPHNLQPVDKYLRQAE